MAIFDRTTLLLTMFLLWSGSVGSAPAVTQESFAAERRAEFKPDGHAELVQQLYLAFFGRPADPAGLAFYVNAMAKSGAPDDLLALADAYGRDSFVRALVNGLSGSPEARALYGDDPTRLIAALYRHGFNRDAEPEGLAYWLQAIQKERLDPAEAVLSILAGAQGSDLATFRRKVDASKIFTSSVDTPAGRSLYSGLGSNALVRSMLGTVFSASDDADIKKDVAASIDALGTGHAYVMQDDFAEVPAGGRTIALLVAAEQHATLRPRLDALERVLATDLNGRSGKHGPVWKIMVRQASATVPLVREQLKGMTAAILIGDVVVPRRVDGYYGEEVPNLEPYRNPFCTRYQFPNGPLAVEPGQWDSHIFDHNEDPACRHGMTVSLLRGSAPLRQDAELKAKLDQMITYHGASDRENARWSRGYTYVNALWLKLDPQPADIRWWDDIPLYETSELSIANEGRAADRLAAFKSCLTNSTEMCTFNGHGSRDLIVAEGPDPDSEFRSSDAVAFTIGQLREMTLRAKFVSLESCSTQNFLHPDSFGSTMLMAGETLLVMGSTSVAWAASDLDKHYIQEMYQWLSYGATFAEVFTGKMNTPATGIQGDPFISLRPKPSGPQPKLVIDGLHYNVHPAVVRLALGDSTSDSRTTRTLSITNPGASELRIRLSSAPEYVTSTGRIPNPTGWSRGGFGFDRMEPAANARSGVGNVGDIVHVVAPGSSLQLKLGFEPEIDGLASRRNYGIYTGTYTMYSNDPQSPRITFEMSAIARP
ncbi:hypothetical protein [Telluria aromaticivorans]|uniref:DUF4214 domain-containing protein n=1 Tax=Telluria aromaticivorans TaxID=2725995 RepID=A0A7Y2K495_9BURK|nr:hypothetical protein [Telluria aromaticivorans]NNG25878.1 DUF4214 domain-containing protein [Telluria aromaticivorans]